MYIFFPSIDLAIPFVSAFQFTQEAGLNFEFGPSTFDLLICISLTRSSQINLRDRIPSKTWITDIGFAKSILFAVPFILLFLFPL